MSVAAAAPVFASGFVLGYGVFIWRLWLWDRKRAQKWERIRVLEGALVKAEAAILDAQNIICPEDRLRWVGSGIVLDDVRAALAGAKA